MKTNRVLIFFIVMFLPLLQGCFPLVFGAALGAAGYAYIKGGLSGEYEASVSEANAAALASLQELGYFVVSDELKVESSTLKAEDGRGGEFEVQIKKLNEYKVRAYVRGGLFGGEERAFQILEMMAEKLL